MPPPLTTVAFRTFAEARVRLDGKAFAQCTFTDCVLMFDGVQEFTMIDCALTGATRVVLQEAALLTVQMLNTLSQDPATRPLVEATFAAIRAGTTDTDLPYRED